MAMSSSTIARLRLQHARHIDRSWTDHHPERGRAVHQLGDLRAPDLVFARETVDVRARAADPLAFHDGRPLRGVGHVPRQVFARLATAEDENVYSFRLSHDDLLACTLFDMPEKPCRCANLAISSLCLWSKPG
jgi:hypothetical protein